MYSKGSQSLSNLLVKLILYVAFSIVLYSIDKYYSRHLLDYFIPAIFVYFYFIYRHQIQNALY